MKVGESVMIGNVAVITLEAKSGQIARIAVEADKSVLVSRIPKPAATHAAAAGGIREPSKQDAISA